MMRRWARQFVTRFGAFQQVYKRFDLISFLLLNLNKRYITQNQTCTQILPGADLEGIKGLDATQILWQSKKFCLFKRWAAWSGIFILEIQEMGDLSVFESICLLPTCLYYTRWKLHTVPLFAERQAGKLWKPISVAFGVTRPGIEPKFTA